jgi:hypothetical protein
MHPSPAYLLRPATSILTLLSKPQPLLLVLDLNGTLISRSSLVMFQTRPGFAQFLEKTVEKDIKVLRFTADLQII